MKRVKVNIHEEFAGLTFELRSKIPLLRRHLEILAPHRTSLLNRWADSYREVFGKHASLKGRRKNEVFGLWMDRFFEGLETEGDFLPHYRRMVEFGHFLAENNVPLEEIILSLHIFEEISFPLLMSKYADEDRAKVIYALDMLFHNELACMSLAYFTYYRNEIRRLDRIREDLTHMIVHDMRNPLNVIVMASESLLKDLDKTGLVTNREYLSLIAGAGNEMLLMVNNLLDINKMEKGKFVLHKERGDLNELIDQLILFNELKFRGRGISVVFNKRKLPEFLFDRQVIKRVLDNLIDNAVKHSPRGGKVEISASAMDRMVEVSVADQGEGIAREDQKAIFEKFVQAGLSKQGKIFGTGLGLTFCRMAVENSGGSIRVESSPGRGSKFIFTLPIK